jgi:hypothetical protein
VQVYRKSDVLVVWTYKRMRVVETTDLLDTKWKKGEIKTTVSGAVHRVVEGKWLE